MSPDAPLTYRELVRVAGLIHTAQRRFGHAQPIAGMNWVVSDESEVHRMAYEAAERAHAKAFAEMYEQQQAEARAWWRLWRRPNA